METMTLDMRTFAAATGTTMTLKAGSIVFSQGDPPGPMYVVQSGEIEVLVGDKVVDVCVANDALGFMSMVDGGARTTTARAKTDAEVSILDARKFRFMVDEVPNFAQYVMGEMAQRIRGLGAAL